MDFVKKFAGGSDEKKSHDQQSGGGKSGGGIGDKLSGMMGGGSKGEKNEDGLDKGEILPNDPSPFPLPPFPAAGVENEY